LDGWQNSALWILLQWPLNTFAIQQFQDLLVRYALGYENLAEGDFELRTLYNFRQRLSQHNLEHGANLLAAAFTDITDQQLATLAVRTNQQRMDSTQIALNIVIMSRLQLYP
jgi:hypothetical protein